MRDMEPTADAGIKPDAPRLGGPSDVPPPGSQPVGSRSRWAGIEWLTLASRYRRALAGVRRLGEPTRFHLRAARAHLDLADQVRTRIAVVDESARGDLRATLVTAALAHAAQAWLHSGRELSLEQRLLQLVPGESWLLAELSGARPTDRAPLVHPRNASDALRRRALRRRLATELIADLSQPELALRRVVAARRLRAAVLLLGLLLLLGVGTWSLRGWVGDAPDLAAARPWQASSGWNKGAVRGKKPVDPLAPYFFATEREPKPWLIIDLETIRRVSKVVIVNRSDCCQDRAVPVTIQLSIDREHWQEVARREEPFHRWSTDMKGARGRFIRFSADRSTWLHFKDVQVFGQ